MMDLLQTTEERIRDIYQGEGAKFTYFGDRLIRSHAFALGLPDAEIETTGTVNDPDGGVDTLIRKPMPSDNSGWFNEKTAWQYKGQSYENVNKQFADLFKGEFLKKCVNEGFSYRLVVADSLTSEQRSHWEERLKKGIAAINSNAPPPRVVTAADLAALANRYPAFVLLNFHPDELSFTLHMSAWRDTFAGTTPSFVEVPAWNSVGEMLRTHARFDGAVASAVQTVQGEAGVGKTRLTYETLAALSGTGGLVLYCDDTTNALRLARYIANQRNTRAIIVADECGPEERLKLMKLADGHAARLRVIAIDNSQVRANGRTPELSLEKMSVESLEKVLGVNFPDVSPERRASYAALAKGFPRFAADLCKHDRDVAPDGHLGPAIGSIAAYLEGRLPHNEWSALRVLSLVTKIGFTGDARDELSALCSALKLNRDEVEQNLQKLRSGPGFAVRGGRYFYTSPEVVAAVAFDGAWRQWGADDPDAFLKGFPPQLLQSFQNRVKKSASKEVRRVCAAYFRSWASSLSIAQLTDLAVTKRFGALIETSPRDYLPVLSRLVEKSELDALRTITGDSSINGEWGPRRALVWLLEGLAQFPEHFVDVERILLRFALAESEPNIGNNATAIWRQLFRIILSGTATPFLERFAHLHEHVNDSNLAVRTLAIQAIDEAFSQFPTRMAGSTTVAGRIPPPEWSPQSWDEQASAYHSMIAALSDRMRIDKTLHALAAKTLIKHTRMLLDQQLLQEVRLAFDGAQLSDVQRAELLEEIDEYLIYDADRVRSDDPFEGTDDEALDTDSGPSESSQYVDAVREWRASVAGASLHDRLVALVSRQRFSTARFEDEEGWQKQLNELAVELLADPAALSTELPWLLSGTVASVGELGECLGRHDIKASQLDTILNAATPGPHRELARGYIHGLIAKHPHHASALNAWLDTRETTNPETVADFALRAGSEAHALERVLRLYDEGKLPVGYLHERNFSVRERVNLDGLSQLLERLALAAERGDVVAMRVGLDSVSTSVPYKDQTEILPMFAEHPGIVKHVWTLLDAGARLDAARLKRWDSIVIHLGRLDPLRAVRFTCGLMFEGGASHRFEGERVFKSIAQHFPSEMMQALGESMLDQKRSVYFYTGRYRSIFKTIPADTIKAWLEQHGTEGARRIARHLPVPYVDGAQNPVVPQLTEWVMSKFEDDERTFREFCMGVHSFQVYSGDIAVQHEVEAEIARRFLQHPLRRIREWAVQEEESALRQAKRWRQRDEEDFLPE